MLNDTRTLKCFLSLLHSVRRPTWSMSMSNDLPFPPKNVFFSCFCCSVSSQFFPVSAYILGSVQPHREANLGSGYDLLPYLALAVCRTSIKLVLTLMSFPHFFLYSGFNCLLSVLYCKCSEVKTTSILLSISIITPTQTKKLFVKGYFRFANSLPTRPLLPYLYTLKI